MTYILSFFFNDESNAQNKTILLNAFVGALGSSVILILRQVEETMFIGKVLEFILCIIPSFAFSDNYTLRSNLTIIYLIEFQK